METNKYYFHLATGEQVRILCFSHINREAMVQFPNKDVMWVPYLELKGNY